MPPVRPPAVAESTRLAAAPSELLCQTPDARRSDRDEHVGEAWANRGRRIEAEVKSRAESGAGVGSGQRARHERAI